MVDQLVSIADQSQKLQVRLIQLIWLIRYWSKTDQSDQLGSITDQSWINKKSNGPIDPWLILINRQPNLHRSIDLRLIWLVWLIQLIWLICQALCSYMKPNFLSYNHAKQGLKQRFIIICNEVSCSSSSTHISGISRIAGTLGSSVINFTQSHSLNLTRKLWRGVIYYFLSSGKNSVIVLFFFSSQ